VVVSRNSATVSARQPLQQPSKLISGFHLNRPKKSSPEFRAAFFIAFETVNHPNPAIVSQAGARRLPRVALLLLCLAYILPGFLGRDAWKSEDMAALGFMVELVRGSSEWLAPTLIGLPADNPAVLPYWLGAWAMQMAPTWASADFVARIPFILLLGLSMLATWYGTYYLARNPLAQPVPFAFGGEALPADYARAMADGGLLAFIACLGLAQLAHETTPAVAQLGFSALFFYAMGALPYRRTAPAVAALLGLVGLSLSGAPSLTILFGLGGAALHYADRATDITDSSNNRRVVKESIAIALTTLISAVFAMALGLLRWKLELPHAQWADWGGYVQLLVWFTWPAWPLTLWTLWRWRHQLFSRRINRHVALPAWLVLVCVMATLVTGSPDRTLLLALPPLATLAAFALPTLKRQVSALIDWFTLLFFSGWAFTIWVVWIAMQTGMPAQPAANVARLAPGFVSSFSLLTFATAALATLAWAWLVKWRVGRHRAAIWKSLVLPAGGVALCWLLFMTLWMPLLNYAQSYAVLVQRTKSQLTPSDCVETLSLGQGQISAFQFYGNLRLLPLQSNAHCSWLLAEPLPDLSAPSSIDPLVWAQQALIQHPAHGGESVLLFKRVIAPSVSEDLTRLPEQSEPAAAETSEKK
jgi:4-amino-4-deoxy-L-arabinose transferase-like glycosyltransferase